MDTTAVDTQADFDAATELLRQAAIREGLLDAADPPAAEGVISAAASQAIETLLEREIRVPEPSEEACRRHHAAHAAQYTRGERAALRHVLFAVTPGVDVVALRKRAEACLLDVRCHDGSGADRFAAAARELSNCPSGANGGDLGWLAASDCAPEFAREVFGHAEVGVLPRLVHSRFGLHVVEVLQRESGEALPFEAVRGAIEATLRQQSYATALRQYVQLLGGAESPLVQ
ncbi:MAG: peptidylprolyl isomerase [Proteobacteria bacterium]|nr:peptidylprolyl isomerase [Pseudomonadota bacterium]